MKSQSFGSHAVKLFNILPKDLRNSCLEMPLSQFKLQLDKYIETIPDEPHVTGYAKFRRAASNSLIDMVPKVLMDQKLPGTRKENLLWGGSPTSP